MPSFLPSRDSLLLAWSSNFSTQISATPTAFGLTAAQATAYAALHTAYSTAYTAAIDPATRTKANISTKNVAKKSLRTSAQDLAKIANAFPTITNAQRILLGLTPRSGTITPVNPPTEAPVMEIVSTNGRTIKLRLHSQSTKSKPAGVKGASLFSFVGATPPADIDSWKFEGSTTRTHFEMSFSSSTPAGSQVFLTAFWFNPRSQSGPACTPVSAYIAGGVSMAA